MTCANDKDHDDFDPLTVEVVKQRIALIEDDDEAQTWFLLSPAQARRLATALVRAADTVQRS